MSFYAFEDEGRRDISKVNCWIHRDGFFFGGKEVAAGPAYANLDDTLGFSGVEDSEPFIGLNITPVRCVLRGIAAFVERQHLTLAIPAS